jgi:hypothetical protein
MRLVAPVLFMVVIAWSAVPLHRDVLRLTLPRAHQPYQTQFVQQFVGAREVVLSDVRTSWLVPAFAGRIVAVPPLLPQYAVVDEEGRREALVSFFDPATTRSQRSDTLRRYRVDWVLYNRSTTSAVVAVEIRALGPPVATTDRYTLVRVVRTTPG